MVGQTKRNPESFLIQTQLLQVMNRMQKTLGLIAICALLGSLSTSLNAARIKDLTDPGGIRYNQLEGMGIISGLDGKGDRKLDASNRALVNAIRQYGLTLDLKDVDKAKNFAFTICTGIAQLHQPSVQG